MKLVIEGLFNALNADFAEVDNQYIVHIENYSDALLDVHKDTLVRFDEYQFEFLYILREVLISNSKRLLEFIESLIQLINFDVVLAEIIELSHINRLLNVIVEKDDFDVYLFHVLV